jgi:hypothetical protein
MEQSKTMPSEPGTSIFGKNKKKRVISMKAVWMTPKKKLPASRQFFC